MDTFPNNERTGIFNSLCRNKHHQEMIACPRAVTKECRLFDAETFKHVVMLNVSILEQKTIQIEI